jgi:DNA mismatch repair protein MutL
VLNMRLAPESVNQNAHPGKLRVALLEAKRIEGLLQDAVTQALGAHPLVSSAPEPRVVTAPQPTTSHFPELRFIGTYRDAYMLAEGDGDLWLLDQHAAHERILFEELEHKLGQAEALELETPELLPLAPDVALQLESKRDELEGWGFAMQPFGGGLYRITRVPAAVAGISLETVVNTLLPALSAPDARREFLARMACLPAIKAGHRLTRVSADSILETLRTCTTPWACPHGRPTALRIHERDLAHQFGRRGVRDLPKSDAKLEPIKESA